MPQAGNAELWPAILTKGMLKVLNLYIGEKEEMTPELLNTALIHMLTGWVPEKIPWLQIIKSNRIAEPAIDSLLSGGREEIWQKHECATKEWVYEVSNPEDGLATDESQNKYSFAQNPHIPTPLWSTAPR